MSYGVVLYGVVSYGVVLYGVVSYGVVSCQLDSLLIIRNKCYIVKGGNCN